jgi:hypothetical protein
MPAAAVAPIVNVSFGKEFFNMVKNGIEPASAPRTPLCSPPRSTYNLQCLTLLPANHTAGVNMLIADFCATYDLVRPIKDKLVENGYLHSRFLCFVTIDELKQMNFLLGEIATIRDEVNRWSLS